MNRVVDVKAAVVVPNWNGVGSLKDCLDSLLAQSLKPHVIVVDNGSRDGSLELLKHYPVEVIEHRKNLGFAGGVNAGFQRAMDMRFEYVAAFNNDAVADKDWLKKLVGFLDKHPKYGIAACKLLNGDGSQLDSTGDYYTVWGLPYPRGRGERQLDKYDHDTDIFAASGGASLYRVKMLAIVGLFDEDFFAYYEDVDLSFRAQLAGWKVGYVPGAKAYHQIGATSGKIKGFTAYQTIKNLPILLMKNVPSAYRRRVSRRLLLALILFFGRALSRGQIWPVVKGVFMVNWLFPSTLRKRRRIQASRQVDDAYIWKLMVHDLPPNARALRRVRGWL